MMPAPTTKSVLIAGFALSLLPLHAQTPPDPLWWHYQQAQDSLRASNPDRATKEYTAFLAEALHRVANAQAQAGELYAAANTFEETLAVAPDNAVRLDYASVLFDANRWPEAQAEAQKTVDSDPKNARAQVLLGRIFYEQQDYASAKLHFEAAVSQGEFTGVWRLLSLTYLRLQELAPAQSLLHAALIRLGNTPANRVAVATVYYYGDRPDEAIAELKKILAQDPAAPEAHYYLGLAYLARNEQAGYAKAVPEFRAQLKLQPNAFPSHYMLGYIALQQREFAEAEPELERAVSLNPNDAGTQLLLAQFYSETHREPLAEKTLRQLIASSNGAPPDATLVRAHYMLGRALQQGGQTEEAAKETQESQRLRRTLRQSADEPGRADSHAREFSGHGAKGQLSEHARQQVQAFISQMSPLIAEAYFNLGGIAAHRGDESTAAQFRQKAVSWDPSLAQGQK